MEFEPGNELEPVDELRQAKAEVVARGKGPWEAGPRQTATLHIETIRSGTRPAVYKIMS